MIVERTDMLTDTGRASGELTTITTRHRKKSESIEEFLQFFLIFFSVQPHQKIFVNVRKMLKFTHVVDRKQNQKVSLTF